MGMQNTPEKGCWKASKSDDSEVNLRYRDLSGSIIIRFTDDAIVVDRLGTIFKSQTRFVSVLTLLTLLTFSGSAPSMNFLLHESIILNSFLDELHAIVYEGEISDENRLLTLVDEDAIEQARNCVSFA